MAYSISFLGTKVVCDTPDEVRALLAGNGKTSTGAVQLSALGLDGDERATVIVGLPTTQRGFLDLLANSGEVSDAQARDALHLEDNKGLAGVRAAIAKRFKNAGLADPVHMEKRFKGGARSYRYRLGADDAQLVKMIAAK